MKSYLLHPNGAMVEYRPKTGERFLLAEISKAIGGNLSSIPLQNGRIMFMDREGYDKQLHSNRDASLMVGTLIVGPVLVVQNTMVA